MISGHVFFGNLKQILVLTQTNASDKLLILSELLYFFVEILMTLKNGPQMEGVLSL